MVERSDWKGAASLPVRQTKFSQVVAITHFARALGAARSGDPDAAKAEIAALADSARQADGRPRWPIWPIVVDIERQIATAWMLHAEGKYDGSALAL